MNMGYHYESHTTTTNDPYNGTQTTSVIVRELDEGEVGILLAGNNSIFDPSLTPRMLSVSTTNYDVDNAGLSPLPHDEDNDDDDSNTSGEEEEEEEEDDEHWFPSLRHNSWIEGLDDDDDDDDIMVDKMVENLFATAIVEKEEEDDDNDKDRHSKARKGDQSSADSLGQRQRRSRRHGNTPNSMQSSSRMDQWMDEEEDNDSLVRLVPVDIIYVVVND